MTRRLASATAILLLSALTTQAQSSEVESLIKKALKRAVVKVLVSANDPVFDENSNNLCNSAGTGFLITGSYAVTANHVLEIDPRCKDVVIMMSSFPAHREWQATLVDKTDDVALLKFEPAKPTSRDLCSLVVAGKAFESPGIKFGIPGGLIIDPPAMSVEIGAEDGGFKPLATITPVVTEQGESGGPIIHNMTVVGLLKARHPSYPAYSFMVPNDPILKLMKDHNLSQDETACNPVFAAFEVPASTNNDAPAMLNFSTDGSPVAQAILDLTAAQVVASPGAWNDAPIKIVPSEGVEGSRVTLNFDGGLPNDKWTAATDLTRKFTAAYSTNLWSLYESEVKTRSAYIKGD